MSKTEILVPFSVDTDFIEKKFGEDAAKDIIQEVKNNFEQLCQNELDRYFECDNWGDKKADTLVKDKITEVLNAHQDEIIEGAIKRISVNLVKRKDFKKAYEEFLNSLEDSDD